MCQTAPANQHSGLYFKTLGQSVEKHIHYFKTYTVFVYKKLGFMTDLHAQTAWGYVLRHRHGLASLLHNSHSPQSSFVTVRRSYRRRDRQGCRQSYLFLNYSFLQSGPVRNDLGQRGASLLHGCTALLLHGLQLVRRDLLDRDLRLQGLAATRILLLTVRCHAINAHLNRHALNMRGHFAIHSNVRWSRP